MSSKPLALQQSAYFQFHDRVILCVEVCNETLLVICESLLVSHASKQAICLGNSADASLFPWSHQWIRWCMSHKILICDTHQYAARTSPCRFLSITTLFWAQFFVCVYVWSFTFTKVNCYTGVVLQLSCSSSKPQNFTGRVMMPEVVLHDDIHLTKPAD